MGIRLLLFNHRNEYFYKKMFLSSCLSLSLCLVNFHSAGTNVNWSDTSTNKKIVYAYLSALKNFDHAKMKTFIHPSMLFPDSKMKGYRAFEKEMRTVWIYTILKANEDSVFAEETEDNIFYDCLGVGARYQEYCYVLKDGLIFLTIQINMHHIHGEYKAAYARFLNWLLKSPAKNDSLLLRNEDLIFDGESAIRMKPWLQQWKRLNE